jgi:hypothetical protein
LNYGQSITASRRGALAGNSATSSLEQQCADVVGDSSHARAERLVFEVDAGSWFECPIGIRFRHLVDKVAGPVRRKSDAEFIAANPARIGPDAICHRIACMRLRYSASEKPSSMAGLHCSSNPSRFNPIEPLPVHLQQHLKTAEL